MIKIITLTPKELEYPKDPPYIKFSSTPDLDLVIDPSKLIGKQSLYLELIHSNGKPSRKFKIMLSDGSWLLSNNIIDGANIIGFRFIAELEDFNNNNSIEIHYELIKYPK